MTLSLSTLFLLSLLHLFMSAYLLLSPTQSNATTTTLLQSSAALIRIMHAGRIRDMGEKEVHNPDEAMWIKIGGCIRSTLAVCTLPPSQSTLYLSQFATLSFGTNPSS